MAKGSPAFDAILISVWRQALVEKARSIVLDGRSFPVRRTPSKNLAQVDFEFEGVNYRGLEQNRRTNSRWAQLARRGGKVMQFLEAGKYVAVVADGRITHYSRRQTES